MNAIIIILLAILFSAFFSGLEIAFVSSNKLRMELDIKQGVFGSGILRIFSNNPGQYIATMLIGNNIALVIYGLIMAKMLDPILAPYIKSEIALLTLQTVISTLFILVIAEFLPKVIFRSIANNSLNFLSVPILVFYAFFCCNYTAWCFCRAMVSSCADISLYKN